MLYTFVDGEGNNLKNTPGIKDNSQYLVLWRVENGDGGMYFAYGKDLREIAELAQHWPVGKSISIDTGNRTYFFKTVQEVFDCIHVRKSSSLARELRDLLPIMSTPVFSMAQAYDWDTWASDHERGIDWTRKWHTQFVKEREDMTWASFSGNPINLEMEGVPTIQDIEAAEPHFKRYNEPENDNPRCPWYAENVVSGEREYYNIMTTLVWNTVSLTNACSTGSVSALYDGGISHKNALLIFALQKEGYEVTGLKKITVNHEMTWVEGEEGCKDDE